MPTVFDDRHCVLGEGPLWHPQREQLFWFDIPLGRLMTPGRYWDFGQPASAAAWVDHDTLLIAMADGLYRFSIPMGKAEQIVAVEADNPVTRSNDGRADPMGGFWFGTMGRNAEPEAGAIYRYYRGELRQLFPNITIPNAICFAPDGRTAYFTDTPTRCVWAKPLNTEGWPVGDRHLHIQCDEQGGNPDGAVCDAEGHIWLARWGGWQVTRHDLTGRCVSRHAVPAEQVTCPVFAGENLYVTTAREGLSAEALITQPDAGAVFHIEHGVAGRAEPQVIL